MPAIEINDNHRRALSSVLQIVQHTLAEFMTLTAREDLCRDSRLTPEQVQELRRRISAAQEHLKHFRRVFDIPQKEDGDPLWAIQVGVSHLWELLEDCKSRRMRGYGKVPESTQPVLDRHVQELIDLVEAIAAVVRGER